MKNKNLSKGKLRFYFQHSHKKLQICLKFVKTDKNLLKTGMIRVHYQQLYKIKEKTLKALAA